MTSLHNHLDIHNKKSELGTDGSSKSEAGAVKTALRSANAMRLEAELLERNQEIAALQSCPVCREKGRLVFQSPEGFKANCATCGADRYLRGQKDQREYEQLVAGKKDFRTLGRRGWALLMGENRH